MEKKIVCATPEQVKKSGEEFCKRFPVSMNMIAGNEEKARELLKEKENERGSSYSGR